VTSGQAVVVMPPSVSGQGLELNLRRWLSRGVVTQQFPERESLTEVLMAINRPVPTAGLAALRYLGQTGVSSNGWIAAADPVHFEARLRDVRLRSLPCDENIDSDIQEIFSSLNESFGTNRDASFVCINRQGYLLTRSPLRLPSVSAYVADGHVPDKFTPSGSEAKAYHQLLGEIQLLMHEHPVNIRRQEQGLPVINSLWLWGGGTTPEITTNGMPDLYTADHLFVGYWAAANIETQPWSSFANCVEISPHGFVAVLDESSVARLQDCISDLAGVLKHGKMQRLAVLFRDGLAVEINKFDRFKIWRGMSPFLDEYDQSEEWSKEVN